MSYFLHTTLDDLRGGRQSWRVLIAVCTPAFAISLTLALLQRF